MRRPSVGIPAPEENTVPNRPFLQPVAIAGAVAISASLIGFAALPQTSGPPTQTRAVTLTSGDAEVFLPDLSTFTPTVAEGFPPIEEVLQGAEEWSLVNSPGEIVDLDGNDTQTTIGSFVNNDFLESGGDEGGAGMGEPLPYPGSEIDLMSFGGGYESEWANLIDASGGQTTTDTLITPFGNYTIPLGSTPPPPESDVVSVAAAAPADGFSNLLSSIEYTTNYGEHWFTLAETAFADGNYSIGVADELAGFNNLTTGVGNDVLLNGYAALAGGEGIAGFALDPVARPADFATGLTEAQGFLSDVQPVFNDALTSFAAGDGFDGLVGISSIATDYSNATDAIILGLFDSLPGVTVSF
jgi:hypothetical protein